MKSKIQKYSRKNKTLRKNNCLKKNRKSKKNVKHYSRKNNRRSKVNKMRGGTHWVNKCAVCFTKFKWSNVDWINKFGPKPDNFNSYGINSNKNEPVEEKDKAEILLIDKISELSCGHMFHTECIIKVADHDISINETPKCPLCRLPFSKNDILPVGNAYIIYDTDYFTKVFNTILYFNVSFFFKIYKINYNINIVKSIYEALKTNSTLTHLTITDNYYRDIGVNALAEALKVNKTLTYLDISNNISNNYNGDDVVIAIADALTHNTSLIKLYMRILLINDSKAKALANSLKINSTLTLLDISNNNIGDEGAEAFAEALKVNSTLTLLDISNNYINDAGAKAFAEALKVNSSLIELNLYGNAIYSSVTKKTIKKLLTSNKNLTEYEVLNNNIVNIEVPENHHNINNNEKRKVMSQVSTKTLGSRFMRMFRK